MQHFKQIYDVMTALLLRKKVAISFWRTNDVIIPPCVRCDNLLTNSKLEHAAEDDK